MTDFGNVNEVSVSSSPITKVLNREDIEITLKDVLDVFTHYLELKDTKMIETVLAVVIIITAWKWKEV